MKILHYHFLKTVMTISLLAPIGFVHAEQDSAALARGASAWENVCARCHNMRDAREFRDDQWKVIVMHMRVRAGITGQEARDILMFLQDANNGEAMPMDSQSSP